jgi:hypothetical protein
VKFTLPPIESASDIAGANAGDVIGSPGRINLSIDAGDFAADFLQMQR